MKRKLTTALIRHSSEQGFALPIAFGLGLAMLLIGAMMIVSSQDDRNTAYAQTTTAQSLEAAEAGITRIGNSLSNNRVMALYNDSDWQNGTVDSQTTYITSFSCSSSSGSSTSVQNFPFVTKNWQNLTSDTTSYSRPQYRLISYTYSNASTYTAPGTGTLVVEGKIGDAQSQIQVTIPVKKATAIPFPYPGMWVKTTPNSGNTNANIMAPCGVSQGGVTLNPGYQFSNSPFTMPTPPSAPPGAINIGNPAGMTLPRIPGDTPNASGVYEYSASQISGGFTFTPGYKVTIYLSGNISMSGNQDIIQHNCTGVPNCVPTDARIYGLSSSSTATFQTQGNPSICSIFFWAPNYSVNINGGGQAQGCQTVTGTNSNNTGVYWVNSWLSGGQGNYSSIEQANANWNDILAVTGLPDKLPPTIAPVDTWQRQETN